MRSNLLPAFVGTLLLLTSCGGNDPATAVLEAAPVADGAATTSSNDVAPRTAEYTVKSAGLLSYDGNYAILTDCDGKKTFLVDALMLMLVEEIKHYKADPNDQVWVVVGTENEGKPYTDGSTRVHGAGVVISKERVNPCNTSAGK